MEVIIPFFLIFIIFAVVLAAQSKKPMRAGRGPHVR